MRLPPVDVLLSWPKANYVNPITRGNELIILTVILSPLALAMVALRIYTRLRLSKSFGIDDVFLLISVPPAVVITVLTVLSVHDWGWDRHVWDVKLSALSEGLKMVMVMECLFAFTVCSYKISLLILTRRIMSSSTGHLRHVAALGIGIVAAEGLVFILVVVFTCTPVSAYWTLSAKPQKCINERLHLLIGGIINTSTDFFIFFLPIPTLLKLRVPLRQQVILVVLFGAGLIVCLAGCVRIYYVNAALLTWDRTWASYGVWISSVVELYIGLICASLPATKPFFSRYLPALLGTTATRKYHSQGVPTIGGSSSRGGHASKNGDGRFVNLHSRGEADVELGKLGKQDASSVGSPSSDETLSNSPGPDATDGKRSENRLSIASFTGRRGSRRSTTPRSKFALPGSKNNGEELDSKTYVNSSTEELVT